MAERIIITVDSELEDIVPGYLENRRNDISHIKKSLDEGDYETIRVLGHSMKGSGGGYGFDRITEIGAAIEQAAKKKDSEEIKKQIAELQDFLDRVEVRYE